MSDGMIERVARALCGDGREADDVTGGPHPSGIWLEEGEAWWTGYVEQASAAIAAMREPNDAMVRAGSTAETGMITSEAQLAVRYMHMIDAALAEKPE